MEAKKITKEKVVRYTALYAALLFCLFSLVFFSIRQETNKAFMSFVSIFYVWLPSIAERLFKFRIQPPLYVVIIVYTICPLIGYSYDFYYYLTWWDDILHAFAGVIFAMFGAYLPKVLNKDKEVSVALCAFSAFFFSVAVSGLWELCEFSMDSFFGTDMQKDTELIAMRPSYTLSELLGAPIGQLLEVRSIQILVDGKLVEGYVDLGIIDTMKDIFVETLGAAVYLIIYRAGNGKHFVFETLPDEEEVVAEQAPAPLGTAVEVAVAEAPANAVEEPAVNEESNE